MILIGIDPGVKTGIAIIKNGALNLVEAVKAVEAEIQVLSLSARSPIHVYVEDARLRKWFGANNKNVELKKQGAGSVKRDCKRWEEFCNHHQINYTMIAPKNTATKVTSDYFKNLTGWMTRTNEHGRDAAMLIYRLRNQTIVKGCWTKKKDCDCPACGGDYN